VPRREPGQAALLARYGRVQRNPLRRAPDERRVRRRRIELRLQDGQLAAALRRLSAGRLHRSQRRSHSFLAGGSPGLPTRSPSRSAMCASRLPRGGDGAVAVPRAVHLLSGRGQSRFTRRLSSRGLRHSMSSERNGSKDRALISLTGAPPGPRLGRLRGPHAPRRLPRGRAVRAAVMRLTTSTEFALPAA
jgi:hypothetical protein